MMSTTISLFIVTVISHSQQLPTEYPSIPLCSNRAYTRWVTFPQHCRQNESRTSTSEHTSPLLWILISLRVKVQIFPVVWALLPCHLSSPPLFLSWPHQAYSHLHAAAPSVHSQGFQWTLPSLISGLHPDVMSRETFPDYPAWNSNRRSPLIPAPPSLPIPSASLFYCIATYYHEPAIHWHVFIICIIWRKYILHEIKSFKKDPLLSLLSCHSKHSVNHCLKNIQVHLLTYRWRNGGSGRPQALSLILWWDRVEPCQFPLPISALFYFIFLTAPWCF